MATIHRTTMEPGKLDLLASWLPEQPWYRPTGKPPRLSRAGGFRLDDPAGEVGIEFVFVTDGTDGVEATYSVPLTYRGAPLPGAEPGLVGTAEHGVLGRRWVHDAAYDAVAIAQLLEFIGGRVEAQHQNRSDTLDPSVSRHGVLVGGSASTDARAVSSAAHGTTIAVELTDPVSADVSAADLHVVRVLGDGGSVDGTVRAHVEADWTRPGGTVARRPVAVVR